MTSGFCSVAEVRSTFSWTSRSVSGRAPRGAGDQRLGLLVQDDDARLLLHGLKALLGLDQVLLRVVHLLFEEDATQLSLGDRQAPEHLSHFAVMCICELGGELRVFVVDLDEITPLFLSQDTRMWLAIVLPSAS